MCIRDRPPAASLERTQAVSKQINAILNTYPEVKDYIGISGFSIMGGEESNGSTYFVVLKPWSERKGKEHTAAAVVERFNAMASSIQAVSYTHLSGTNSQKSYQKKNCLIKNNSLNS